MVPRAHKVYTAKQHSIGVFFDTDDPKQGELYQAIRRSFGEGFVVAEEVMASRYRSLHLLPGGLREVR